MREVTIAALQISRIPGDKQANIETAITAIESAAAQGAQIVALPELFSTEYFPQTLDPKFFDYAEPIPGPITDALLNVARRNTVTIVAPWCV